MRSYGAPVPDGAPVVDTRGWFVRLGLTRFVAASCFVVVALFLGDLLNAGNPMPGVLALTAFVVGVLSLMERFVSWADSGRLPWLLGPGRRAAALFRGCVAVGFIIAITVTVVSLVEQGEWVSDHGGVSGLFMTVTLALLAMLALSTALRVLAKLFARPQIITASPVGDRWDSLEAATLLAVCGFCAGGVVVGLLGSPSVTELDARTGSPVLPGKVSRSFQMASDQDLLTGFAPVLAVTLREGRPPQRVDDYLAESSVLRLDGNVELTGPSVNDLDQVECERGPRPCVVVDNPSCPDSPSCEPWELSDSLPRGVFVDEDVVAYGRVLRRSTHAIEWNDSPFGEELSLIAQWWLFAPYDGWRAPLGWTGAEMVKQHAGDWEAVVIGFSEEAPLFVGATSHCGGTWRAFEEVRVDNDDLGQYDLFGARLHPVLGHTEGSHAIYFDYHQGRSPDAFGCERDWASNLFRVGAYALNMRDGTSPDLLALLSPISGPEATSVLEFPAFWGVENDIHLSTPFGSIFAGSGSIGQPEGPSSPSTKPLYREPVTTVFCGRTWHYDGTRSLNESDCP